MREPCLNREARLHAFKDYPIPSYLVPGGLCSKDVMVET
jgi:hypothetical protein